MKAHVRAYLTVSLALVFTAPLARSQDVHIAVDVSAGRRPVSPYLYGKNGGLSDDPNRPLSAANWQFLRDSGVRLLRENAGNNATKYNWQKKLSSHPDWYNNVYAHDWDFAQQSAEANLPGVQVMWAFQLIGRVANTGQHNFGDWAYNQSQWWSGVVQNLAGGGTVNPAGGANAIVNGNPNLYLTTTDAATSTAILDHWIKPGGLGLKRAAFRYWNMDNEPEIWTGTHDDVMPTQIPAEEFMQRYFAYAKQARARYPEIKLAGPVAANEWQWYNYGTAAITADGRQYPWLEYFIKRIGEEQARTGIRLLDVLDIHYYPGITDSAQLLQVHRVFFDRNYVYPEANGVKAVNGGWDNSINKEYVFGRCRDWLEQYLGSGHGVTFGVTETGVQAANPTVAAVWYASMLGEFMREEVEVFTPWTWLTGMWEVLHLYARYNYDTLVTATSDDDTTVSAYATQDSATGNVAVVLVNRSLTQTRHASVTFSGVALPDGSYAKLELSALPATETFVSHTTNALKPGSVTVAQNRFTAALPALSVTTVQLKRVADGSVAPAPNTTRLANVSVRASSGSGAEGLILGFVLGGNTGKQVLVRAAGPALAAFGVSGALRDPVLTVAVLGGSTVATNDDWGAAGAATAALISQINPFPFASGSADSALGLTLAPGSYTVQIGDKQGVRGVTLGEMYDPNAAGDARLMNVSARTWVGADAEALIAGFVVEGDGERTVLVRAVGPGLAAYGVTGVLADPVLRVYRQGQSVPIHQNEDWGAIAYADEMAATANRIQAFPLAAGSKDAALLLNLPRGNYTAVVSGAGGATGIALVEIYDVR